MGEKLHRIKSGKFKDCAYNVCGQGFPVMLVHGFPADHTLWEKQVAVLHKEYQVLLPDIPDKDKSTIINDNSIADIGDFLKAIIHQDNCKNALLLVILWGDMPPWLLQINIRIVLSAWGYFILQPM